MPVVRLQSAGSMRKVGGSAGVGEREGTSSQQNRALPLNKIKTISVLKQRSIVPSQQNRALPLNKIKTIQQD